MAKPRELHLSVQGENFKKPSVLTSVNLKKAGMAS